MLLILLNMRGFLGYVFRFGDPASSPTYAARPEWYFYTWKVLLAVLVGLVLWNSRRVLKRCLAVVIVLWFFVVCCYIHANNFYVLGMCRGIFLASFVYFFISSSGRWIKIEHIDRAFEVLAFFAIIALLWQIYQYVELGILPAHSHEGQLVRYGSFYDDSLVFGILMPMFSGYFWGRFKKRLFWELIVAVVASKIVIMTGGLTAIAVMFLFSVWWFRDRILVACLIVALEVFANVGFFLRFRDILLFKQESIAGHFSSVNQVPELGLKNLIGVVPMDIFVEVGYLSILYNLGVLVLLVVLMFHVYVMYVCAVARRYSDCSSSLFRVSAAAEGAAFSLLFVNLNLAPIVYPPIYLMFAIISGVVTAHASARAA